MRWLAVLVFSWASVQAGAMELFDDGKFVAQAVRGYQIQKGDTLGGYPVYRPEVAILGSTDVSHATAGGQLAVPMPVINLVYRSNGQWAAVQTTTVSAGANSTNGWSGDPCGGEAIVKINRVRGHLDRCAVARFQPIEIGGEKQTVLTLEFVETNSGGRYYGTSIVVNLFALGLTVDAIADEASAAHTALKAWMPTMLDAIVLAAGFNKPANAFDSVPPIWRLLAAK